MKNSWKIAVVLLLAASVAAVVMLKKSESQSGRPRMIVNDSNTAVVHAQQDSQFAKLPRLVDLGADKCIPCKMMASVLDELKKEYAGKLVVNFIDVWKNPDAGKPYKIKLIPTQIFYDSNDKELFRHEGFFSKEGIIGKWKELGVDLRKAK